MKVSVILNGKTYTREKPRVGDWFNYLKFSAANKDKNLLMDEQAATEALQLVSDYTGAPMDEIMEHGDTEQMMRTYQAVQKAIINAHEKAAAAVWGNADAQEQS